jgi:hypothetical protein
MTYINSFEGQTVTNSGSQHVYRSGYVIGNFHTKVLTFSTFLQCNGCVTKIMVDYLIHFFKKNVR